MWPSDRASGRVAAWWADQSGTPAWVTFRLQGLQRYRRRTAMADPVRHHCLWCHLWLALLSIQLRHCPAVGKEAMPYSSRGSMFLEMFFAILAFLTATVAFAATMAMVKAGGALAPRARFHPVLGTFIARLPVQSCPGDKSRDPPVPDGLTIMYLVVRLRCACEPPNPGSHSRF